MSFATQVSALATAIGNNIQALTARVADLEAHTVALTQQGSADPGRTFYVQFAGDPDPVGPVRGDVRVIET